MKPMEETMGSHQPPQKGRSKAVRIIADLVIGAVALFMGAAIVHGMVYTGKCTVKDTHFVAGVLPPDMKAETDDAQPQCTEEQTPDEGNGKTEQVGQSEEGFDAGVLPVDTQERSLAGQNQAVDDQPSAEGATPVPQNQPVIQTSAPAPQPTQQQQAPQVKIQKPSTPAKAEPAKAAPKTTPKTTSATTVKKQTTTKTVSVDLDKLSIAVAMQETHNCKDTKGAALLNNCHGFKRNGKFLAFNSPSESHAYFKQLWVKSYGGVFPTFRLAQIYSGNDNPTQWLKNVTYYYNKL